MTASVASKNVDQVQPSSAGELAPSPPLPLPILPTTTWKCAKCGTQETPVKRSNPQGPGSLCNACGLRARKQKLIADTGAAATAAVAGISPRRRSRQSKRPSPKGKPQKRQANQHPPSPKKQRCKTHNLNNIETKPISLLNVSLLSPAPPSIVAVPSQGPHVAKPVAPSAATGIVVSFEPATQAPIVSQSPLTASTTLPQLSNPISATSLKVPVSGSAAPPMCVIPDGSQCIPTTAIMPFSPSGSPSSPLPPQAPTTQENVSLLAAETPADAMVAQSPHCEQTVTRSGDGIMAAAHKGCVPTVGSAESANEAEQDNFVGSVFTKCNSNGTASMQVELPDLFRETDDDESKGVLLGTTIGIWDALEVGQRETDSVTRGSLPLGESAVVMSVPAQGGNVAQGHGCVAETRVNGQAGLAERYVNQLTILERMSAKIREKVGSIEDRIAVYAMLREELRVARNENIVSIRQLMSAKDIARKKQHAVRESIARTTSLLNVLCKQMGFVGRT